MSHITFIVHEQYIEYRLVNGDAGSFPFDPDKRLPRQAIQDWLRRTYRHDHWRISFDIKYAEEKAGN